MTVQYHEDYGSRVGYYFTVNGTDVISIMRDDILQGRSQAYWKVDQHTLHFFDKATGSQYRVSGGVVMKYFISDLIV